eukprot:4454734-Amphidinium_carterae.2
MSLPQGRNRGVHVLMCAAAWARVLRISDINRGNGKEPDRFQCRSMGNTAGQRCFDARLSSLCPPCAECALSLIHISEPTRPRLI